MSSPLLTVSLVNHSNRDLTLRSLRALETHRLASGRMEIFVLDNASDDGSVDAISREHPAVKLIAQAWRAGFGANHNRVFGESASTYFLILNDDAEVRRETLDQMVRHLEAHPAVAAVAPRIVSPNGRLQQTAWGFITPASAALYACSMGKHGSFVQSTGDRAKQVDSASGCALMLRRSAIETIGMFDERFFMYMEDVDLCRRLQAHGHKINYLPEASVVHESQQSSAGIPVARLNEYWRSAHAYWRKHHGRLGARVAAGFMGIAFATRGSVGAVLALLPRRIRPARADNWPPREFWLEARNAWLGVSGSGLRELADEFNRTAGAR